MHDVYRLPGPPALGRATVDRAVQRRNDDAWLEAAWSNPATRVLLVGDGAVSIRGHDLRFVSPTEAPIGDRFLLGVEDEVPFFAVHLADRPIDGGTLRDVGPVLADRDAGLAVHAIALANWHAAHRYCARCGSATDVRSAGHVRQCRVDGSQHYPRTDPAVIVLVTDDRDRCLLGHAAVWPDRRFSTLAGFVEPGETPEHAVAREAYEESGIIVRSCRYAGGQPWPFPSSLMLAFYATAAGEQPQPDRTELTEVRWFDRLELVEAVANGQIILPGTVSIARRLIEGWFGGDLPERG